MIRLARSASNQSGVPTRDRKSGSGVGPAPKRVREGSCQTRFVRPFRALFVVAGLCSLYCRLLRRRILTWGATEAEAGARLPGDELLEDADGVSTRAVWIDAPAAAVWPWLAQMGPTPRGGAYTYDWIENVLGLGMHSVDHVLPEYQHPQIGDTIALGSNGMRIEQVVPEHVLAWRSDDGNWVWTFVVEERDGRTRLISRNRFRLPTLITRIGMLPMEPGSLLMERKMLVGIKQRGQRLRRREPHSRLTHDPRPRDQPSVMRSSPFVAYARRRAARPECEYEAPPIAEAGVERPGRSGVRGTAGKAIEAGAPCLPLLPVRDFESGLPAGRPSARRRPNRLGVYSAAREHPRDH